MNVDVLLHIGSFMDAQGALAMSQVNKQVRERSGELLKLQFQRAYGDSKSTAQPATKKTLSRLLSYAGKYPNSSVNHNKHKAPTDPTERTAWLAGLENSQDKIIQESYVACSHLLSNTQANSIVQLKNQINALWHLYRKINDYDKFKCQAKEENEKKGSLLSRVVPYLLSYQRKPVASLKLEGRFSQFFAHIGNFTLVEKDYNVVAYHINYGAREQWTYIGIIEAKKNHDMTLFGHKGTCHNFEITEEIDVTSGERKIFAGTKLKFRDSTLDLVGTDRLLDQKLVQIFIETLMQNKQAQRWDVDANRDDFPVLAAGGFNTFGSERAKRTLNEILEFRSVEGNKLYPQYSDYACIRTSIEKQDFDSKTVYYTRGEPQSWSEIIKQDPLLKPGAAIIS